MSWIKLFFFVILLECCTISTQQSRHERFEYKYSFKGPYLAQKDFTVPFFKYDNSAIVSEEMVRLVPSLRSKKGRIWTKLQTSFDWWEVEIWFRVTGRGKIGADGLSFFYTDQILPEGSLFGSSEHFNGLAVIFDSFDNDNKGNNPYIMAMVNDGTKTYNHDTDGFNQQIASCIRDFRNKPFPVRAKIEYYENKLSVLIHNGNTKNDEDYELCFEARDVYLPKNGHFGVSAATGDLADDHDVLKFLTHSLYQPGKIQNISPDSNEKEKYDKEYEAFKQKIDQKETDYYKSHPDEAKKHKNDLDTEYESLGEKEFQQILAIQSEAHELLRNLNHKLDEILGKQERSLTVLNYIQNGNVANVQQGGQPAGHVPLPFQRHEFEALLGQQNELVANSRQIKTSIINMANVANNQPASVQQASQFNQQILSETKEGVNILRKELASIGTKLMSQMPHASAQTLDKCPTCLTSTTFFVAIFVQIGVFIGYNIYKSSSDSQTKKFY